MRAIRTRTWFTVPCTIGRIRRAAWVLLAAGLGFAGPDKDIVDEVHPRDPETPLGIRFGPWFCPACVEEKRIEPRDEPLRMMRRNLDDLLKKIEMDEKWFAIETPHFRILSSIRPTRISFHDSTFVHADLIRLKTIFPKLVIRKPPHKTALTAHQRAHLYHIRVERVYHHFVALTENKKPHLGMKAPYELFLFDNYAPYHRLTDRVLGHVADRAGLQHHARDRPNFMAFATAEILVDRNSKKADKAFNNHVIHNVAHNLVDGHGNYYRETWAWLEEGIGHYYERREAPMPNTFCRAEGKAPQDLRKPDWEFTLYQLVRSGKDTPLNAWCEKLQPAELRSYETGMAWGIVKWLIETEPVRFTMMLRKLEDTKGKPNSAACIQHAFGVSPSVLHQRWREYVLENYARKRSK
ncbi:MAG: hypothetical protein ACYS0E_00690 [Planctomycetota bacterium]